MNAQPPSPGSDRYPAFLRHAHWASALMVLLAYGSVYARNWLERGTAERLLAVQSHFLLGVLLLLLALLRIAVRWRHKPPGIVPAPPPLQQLAAGTTHVALFLFLVVQPALGIAIQLVSGRGIGFPLVGQVLPGVSVPSPDTAKALAGAHVFIGELFIYIIALHVLAALWHWKFRRDNTLQRML